MLQQILAVDGKTQAQMYMEAVYSHKKRLQDMGLVLQFNWL